jgi:hypothetical protein
MYRQLSSVVQDGQTAEARESLLNYKEVSRKKDNSL